MKRRKLLIGLLLLVLVGGLALAQNQQVTSPNSGKVWDQAEFYVQTIYINKIFVHEKGYVAYYSTNANPRAEAFLPNEWFTKTNGPGELVYGSGKSYPYMQIYWKKDGTFDHVKVFVIRNPNDLSWGTLLNRPDLNDKFNTDTLEIQQ